MFKKIVKVLLDERGQGLAEYALVLILIVISAVAALKPVGTSVTSVGTSVSNTIDDQVSALTTP